MKSNLNFLLLKAYTKRYVLLLFLTLGVSVGIGFLCRYDTFRQQTVEKELDGARQQYGTYQICIYGCEREIAQKIVNEDYVVQYSIVDMCVFETEYGMIEACYGDESIFDTMPYQLKYGKFPQNDKQVLCDENGINQLGISEQEIGNGATLSIDGKTYEITGIIKKEYLDTDAYLNSFSVVFKQLEQEKNAQIYLQTDSINYKQYKEEICRKYGIQEEYIEDNYDVLTEVRIEDNGAPTGMKAGLLFFMKWMLHITIFLLFVFLFLMGKRKYKDVESVIEVLGISKIYSDMIFLMLQCLIFLCSGIMVSFFGVITNTYDKSVAIYKTLYYGIGLFVCGFIQCKCEKFHCRTNKVKKIENREKKYNLLEKHRNPYRVISRQNVAVQKGRYGMIIFFSMLGTIILSMASYSLKLVYGTIDEKNYDYQIEFKYKDMVERENGKEEYEKIYQKIKTENTLFSVYPLYYHTLYGRVDKDSVTKEQKEFLREEIQGFYSEEKNPQTKAYTMPMMILSGELKELEKMFQMDLPVWELKEGECIAISRIYNISGTTYKNGMKKGEEIVFNILDGEEVIDYPIVIKEMSDYMNPFLTEGNDMPILIVSQKDFYKLTKKQYPPIILLNKKTEEDITQYFSGMLGVEFTDLKKERMEIDNIKKENSAYIKTFYIVLMLVISIQIIILLYDQYCHFKKPYAYLAAMGMSKWQIMRIYQYDLLFLLRNILIGGLVFGILGTYGIYWFWRRDMYIKYVIPWKDIMLPVGFICGMITLIQMCFWLFYRHANVLKALEDVES